MSSTRQTMAVALAAAAGTLLASSNAFVQGGGQRALAQRATLRGAAGAAAGARVAEEPTNLNKAALGLAFGSLAAAAARRSKRAPKRSGVARAASENMAEGYGEDLSVPKDSFIVLGLAHCFEQVQGKLQDSFVLEPMTASTVEVINNGAATSYEAFVGTTVGMILAQDTSAVPSELLNGREVSWASDLEFRTGCAARTWMREHASTVVRKLAPDGVVKSGFNTSTKDKRILNFVHEVKDSDNVKQDMSIDVYGREGEEDGDAEDQIADLYNV